MDNTKKETVLKEAAATREIIKTEGGYMVITSTPLVTKTTVDQYGNKSLYATGGSRNAVFYKTLPPSLL